MQTFSETGTWLTVFCPSLHLSGFMEAPGKATGELHLPAMRGMSKKYHDWRINVKEFQAI
ncbi:hypothetical protein [Chitinophaga alhagiae]|uniref:hypothetical protein n=1 Tax=Chitinophaga alhagiae TaxID=2203219 RepID=UPI000E5BDA2B|nr:hypothetical protein [Chitinophaga alhagiae]